MAGWAKLDQLAAFINEIKGFNILPENMAALYGTMLPYVEVLVGVLLILGLWTTMASALCSLILCSIILAYGIFPEPVPGAAPADINLFNKDLLLLGASLSLLFSGCGGYGLDNVKK